MFRNGGYPERFAVADPVKGECVVVESIGYADEVFTAAIDNSSTANASNDFTIIADATKQEFDIRGRCNVKLNYEAEVKVIPDGERGFGITDVGNLIQGVLEISFDGEDFLWYKNRLEDVLTWPVYGGGVIGQLGTLDLIPGKRPSDHRHIPNPIVVTDETTTAAAITGLPTPITRTFTAQLWFKMIEASTVPKTLCHLIPLQILDDQGRMCRMAPTGVPQPLVASAGAPATAEEVALGPAKEGMPYGSFNH